MANMFRRELLQLVAMQFIEIQDKLKNIGNMEIDGLTISEVSKLAQRVESLSWSVKTAIEDVTKQIDGSRTDN